MLAIVFYWELYFGSTEALLTLVFDWGNTSVKVNGLKIIKIKYNLT
jgi:hypothetical protein